VTQQARNLAWHLEDEGIELSIVMHDRDRKFAASFDRVFESGGARVVLTPLMAPKANAHAERWIGSCRRECLDWMLIASEGHLRRVLREYLAHYNDERPHRSRDLQPPSGRGDPVRVAAGYSLTDSYGSEGCYLTIRSARGRRDEIYEPHSSIPLPSPRARASKAQWTRVPRFWRPLSSRTAPSSTTARSPALAGLRRSWLDYNATKLRINSDLQAVLKIPLPEPMATSAFRAT
jgi:hypothetical protein